MRMFVLFTDKYSFGRSTITSLGSRMCAEWKGFLAYEIVVAVGYKV